MYAAAAPLPCPNFLQVEVPDVLTRVSEYIPEIVDFVKVLVEKKYA